MLREVGLDLGEIGEDDLRGLARRRGAKVGGEVGDRGVGLVADAAHHRHRAGGDGAGDGLVVEGPEVLDAATAAGDDQHVDAGSAGGGDGGADLRRRRIALDQGRKDVHGHVGRAPRQGGEDVAQRGRLGRGDDADAARQARQGALAFGREQAFALELFAQAGKGLVETAEAGAAQGLHVQLVVAARFEQGDQGLGLDLLAVLETPGNQLGTAAEHDAAHLGRLVLQREVDMAGRGAGQIGYLAGHPQQREAFLEGLAREAVEEGNAEDLRRHGG